MDDLGAWKLPDELRELQKVVRRFMETEVKPVEDKLPHDAWLVPPELLEPLRKKARALGLWCFRTPQKYGGAGLNLLGQAVTAEEAARCRMGLYIWGAGAFGEDPPNVIWEARPEVIEKYGIPSVEGKRKAFIALSEPSGGADPARAIRCRAERRGDRYIINGRKLWISHSSTRDWGILFARTGEQGQRGGISCFAIDGNAKGLSYREVKVIRSYSPYELTFEDFEVPAENMIGEEGQGFQVAERWLIDGRVSYAANTLGVAQAALEMAIEWANQRETFGSRLADKQAIQWMIADSEMEIRAARLLVYQSAWTGDMGQDFKIDSSIAKVMATETAGRVVDRCIQIFGGLGVSQDLPLERWYRELRIKRIGEGPSEVHRMVVARNLLSGGNRRVN